MNVEPILNWLGSSASGWIVAVAAIITLVITWLRGRERPSRVIVEQTLDTTLLSTPKDLDLTDVEPITLFYGDNRIDMLWMTELQARNLGRDAISKVHLRVQVDNETRLLGADLANLPPGTQWDSDTYYQIQGNTLGVALAYLNPFHEHKQETTIKVLCDRKPETLSVEGGGKGWSTVFLSSAIKERAEKTSKRIYIRVGIVLMASSFGVPALLRYLDHNDLAKQWAYISMALFTLFVFLGQPVLERLCLRSFR